MNFILSSPPPQLVVSTEQCPSKPLSQGAQSHFPDCHCRASALISDYWQEPPLVGLKLLWCKSIPGKIPLAPSLD